MPFCYKKKWFSDLTKQHTTALSIFSGVIGIAITIVKIDKEENNGTAKKNERGFLYGQKTKKCKNTIT